MNAKGCGRLKALSGKSKVWSRERSRRAGARRLRDLNKNWTGCASASLRSISNWTPLRPSQLTKIGPRGETPAELALRVVAERDAYPWFVDRPLRFASETGLDDRNLTALFEARTRCGDLIDHLKAKLPSPLDLPDAETVTHWHNDLIAAAEHGDAAGQGPARALRINAENAIKAQALAQTLDDLVRMRQAAVSARWIEPFRSHGDQGRSKCVVRPAA